MPIAEGTKLGPYVVQDVLGQGAMGIVYRAFHAQLERTGAVKVMHGLAPDGDSVSRFRHEAQAIAQMRHPNILNVFDFGDHEGTPYMIVEYVPGGSLATVLKDAPLEPSVALRYLRGIAAGLDHAHSLDIVHRDVKPANVLMEKDGTPVLADFGLVKLLQGSSVRSLTGVTTGTPAYMAPEQVMGHHVGPAADRYSLATIAYEMLTGAIPFDGEGVMEVLYAQVHRDPPAPSSRRPELGPAVDAVIMRGLAKDPDARWLTCSDFVDALAEALTVPVPAPVAKTAPMAPAAVQVKAPAARRAPERTAVMSPPPAATVAMAMPMPEPETPLPSPIGGSVATQPKKSRRRALQITGAIVLILLLLLAMGLCAVIGNRPSLAVNPSIVAAGGTVIVTASHVPANQVGEIQLHSDVQVFAFRASDKGTVDEEITVPVNTDVGMHVVRLCWEASCRVQTNLRVVAPGTILPSPVGSSPSPSSSPSANPSPSPTPSGTPKSTPNTSPRPSPSSTSTHNPSPTPTRRPSPSPSPTPTHPPSPSPSPTPTNPCPTSGSPATLTGPSSVNSGSSFTASGVNFTPNKTVTVSYYDPQTAVNPKTVKTVTVACNGSFSVTFGTTGQIALSRTDKVVACDNGVPIRCDAYTFTLKALLL